MKLDHNQEICDLSMVISFQVAKVERIIRKQINHSPCTATSKAELLWTDALIVPSLLVSYLWAEFIENAIFILHKYNYIHTTQVAYRSCLFRIKQPYVKVTQTLNRLFRLIFSFRQYLSRGWGKKSAQTVLSLEAKS